MQPTMICVNFFVGLVKICACFVELLKSSGRRANYTTAENNGVNNCVASFIA
jgi:hypothetical protein